MNIADKLVCCGIGISLIGASSFLGAKSLSINYDEKIKNCLGKDYAVGFRMKELYYTKKSEWHDIAMEGVGIYFGGLGLICLGGICGAGRDEELEVGD